MTSVAILDETWFLGAEDSGNLVGWRRDDDTGADEVRLGMVQEVRVGEMVNRVRLGEMGGGEVEGVECRALFATTEGTIGIFAALEEGRFVMLEKLERKMEEVDVALGGLDHARYSQTPAFLHHYLCFLLFSWVRGLISGGGRLGMIGRRLCGQRGLLMVISWRGSLI